MNDNDAQQESAQSERIATPEPVSPHPDGMIDVGDKIELQLEVLGLWKEVSVNTYFREQVVKVLRNLVSSGLLKDADLDIDLFKHAIKDLNRGVLTQIAESCRKLQQELKYLVNEKNKGVEAAVSGEAVAKCIAENIVTVHA